MLANVDEDEKTTRKIIPNGSNYKTEAWFLTEDGLYEVLMQSRKPKAKEFKKEVKKILKSIRKTGGYVVGNRPRGYFQLYRMITLHRKKLNSKKRAEKF